MNSMSKFLMIFFLSLSLFFLSGCTSRPIHSQFGFGYSEFQEDSLLIRQGKKGIDQLLGIDRNQEKEIEQGPIEAVLEGDVFSIVILNRFSHPKIEALMKSSSENQIQVHRGELILPYFGQVKTKGQNFQEVKKEIQALIYSEFPESAVVVKIKERFNCRVEIQGAFQGSMPILEETQTVYRLLSQSHFPKEVAFFGSYVKRNGKILSIDLEKLWVEGDVKEDLYLRPHDLIYLADPNAFKVFVLGEVKREGVITMKSSRISLKEVIAKSGGLDLAGNRQYIQVIRGAMSCPKIYTLRYEDILKGSEAELLMIPGDILYVAATPIAEWNRFVQQIIPTVSAYELFHKGIQGVILP